MSQFHIVFVGCAMQKLTSMASHAHRETGCRVSYVVTSTRDVKSLRDCGVPVDDIHHIDERDSMRMPTAAELEELASLEGDGIQTIHNMILSDAVVSKLPYEDALAYVRHLAIGFRRVFRQLQPSVVLGGHDRVQSAMGAAVARAEGFPWFALNFSVVPIGHIALSTGIIPDRMIAIRGSRANEFIPDAERILEEFESGRLKAPAYISAHNMRLIVSRLGHHVKEALRTTRSVMSGRFDRHGDYPLRFKVRRYLRKRKNMLTLPKSWFLTAPPKEPFLFFGLHMQPESTPDVVAPMVSNQLAIIEQVARAMPPTHRFLVKLHISDADNYSRAQLRSILRFPGVRLVAPTVSSREFIDKCDVVLTIAGTMGMEAALLGKPLILFGKMNYDVFPSVRRAGDPFDLPKLVREQIAAERPPRKAIVRALAEYLNTYVQATETGSKVRVDDWTVEASASELHGFADLVRRLDGYLAQRASRAETTASC
jgi:hypothetical protein